MTITIRDDLSPMPVDSFEPNPWGLFNVHGNVLEWCEDFWHDNYHGAPTDGPSWIQDGDPERCVVRGRSLAATPPPPAGELTSSDSAWQESCLEQSPPRIHSTRTIGADHG
jgi:formylglycine-generating enzyme required for sulfatase activity